MLNFSNTLYPYTMTSDSLATFPRYRRYAIDIRSGFEYIQLMNPTNDYLAFSFSALNDQSWTILPCSGIVAPISSVDICVKITNLKKYSNKSYQFKLQWIEVKRTGLIASYIEKNKQQLCNEKTPSNLLSILLAHDIQDQSVIQERLLCANVTSNVKAEYLKTSSVPKYQLKAVPQSITTNLERNDILPITFSSTNRTGKTSVLSLRNIAKDSILLYKILVYGKQRQLFSVYNSWGSIQPYDGTTIQFKAHDKTAADIQGGHFKMLWCLVPIDGEIGDWMRSNVNKGPHVLQNIQNSFPEVKVNTAMLRATMSHHDTTAQMEPKHSPKSNSSRKLMLKCVMGKSLGIYQWQ